MFKDLKNTVAAAPGLVDQSMQMAAQAQQMQAAMGMPGGMPAALDPNDPILAPINGIDLARYAQLSKGVGQYQLGSQEQIAAYMQSGGHTYEDWLAAYEGWNARFKVNMSLSTLYAQYFNAAQV